MRIQLRWALCAVLFAAASVAAAPPAFAAPIDYTFSGLGDGTTWTDQLNWSPQGIPQNGDSITVKQRAGGPSHVTAVPATSLATITLDTGGSLQGAPLVAAQVMWSGGEIKTEVTATALNIDGSDLKTLRAVDGDSTSGRLIVEDTALLAGAGEIRLIGGRVVNHGTIASVASPGDTVLLNGNFGTSAKGKLVNYGHLAAAPNTTLHLINFDIDDRNGIGGTVHGGGTVRIGNSDIHARTTAVLDDSTTIDDGTVLTADGLIKFRDGATLTEEAGNGSTELAGEPLLSGKGTFRWVSGAVTGKLTVRAPMHLDVTGTASHTLNNASAGPLTVEPGATALQQGAGPLTLGVSARISNQGTWRVRTFDARITGVSCCAVTARFDNQGYLELEDGRTLTVANMDFLQRPSGTVRPLGNQSGGTLVVDGGANDVRGGVLTDVRMLLTGNGGVAVSGHTSLLAHASIRQTDSVDVSGAATFSGNGTYRWSDGTVTGQLTFGTDTHFVLDDPATGGARKYLYPDDHPALLDLRGDSTFDSAMPLVVSSTSTKAGRLVNSGTLTWRGGALDYAGVPGALVNHGVLDLRSRLTLAGRFAQDNGGTVRIVIAGHTPSTRGQLVASGTLDLDGRLQLVPVGSAAVNAYSLLNGASRSGRFHRVDGSVPGLVVAYRTKAVVLTER